LNYGADKTGSSDATAAINAAILAARSGGVVYFPAGTYSLSAVSVTYQNINIVGDGPFATTLSPSSTTGNFITFASGHGSISQLAILTTVKRTSGDTIYIDAGGVTISNIQIYASGSGSHYNGIHCDSNNAPGFSILNFLIGSSSNVGIQIGDASSTSLAVSGTIINGQIGSCGNGILIYNCGGLNASCINIISSTSHGVAIYPSSGQTPFALYFSTVLADTCGSDGWFISANGGAVGDVNLTGCWGSSNGGFGLNIAGSSSSSVNGILINGGNYIANKQGGIILENCSNVSLSSVQVYNNSQNGSGQFAGISVSNGVSDFQIVNSVSGNGGHTQQVGYPAYQSYGIIVASGASNNYIIQGNRCPGNLSSGVVDGGSGTSKVVQNNLSS
jgi:hypothetical protein